MKTQIDFTVLNTMSFIQLYPESQRAKEWAKKNLNVEQWQIDYNEGIAVDHRMFDDIYDAILAGGMSMQSN